MTAEFEWQRISRWSVLYYAMGSSGKLISTLAGIYIVTAFTIGNALQYFVALGILSALLIVAWSAMRYSCFRYLIGNDSIQIRRGIFYRSQINMQFERIQNITLQESFYFRWLGMTTMHVDSAGAQGNEIVLPCLAQDIANSIRQTILSKMNSRSSQVLPSIDSDNIGSEASSRANKDLIYRRSIGDIAIYGLTNLKSLVAIGLLIGLLGYTPFSIEVLMDYLPDFVESRTARASLFSRFDVLIIGFAVAVSIIAVFSVFGSIVKYFNFSIYRKEDSLLIHQGLFHQRDIQVRKSRIQSIHIRQNFLEYLIHRVNVTFEQIHFDSQSGNQENAESKIFIPSAKSSELAFILNEYFPVGDISKLTFEPANIRYFFKQALVYSTLYFLLGMTLYIIYDIRTLYIAYILVLFFVHIFLIFSHWKKSGITLKNEIVIIRKGIVGVEYTIFPISKLQVVDHIQSIPMMRKKLSSIVFHTASGATRAKYLSNEHAITLIDYCVYFIESNANS